ncbi:hypothetical protein KY349_02405 [Candidatus Woesearchaeota archaeon]|nr:hypothetical protein [Candidatus Woesearchaeota archaeon]
MAVKPKKGKGVDKWRKKKYFSILAPKLFQERELGQTIAYDPSSLEGRRMASNLMVLTGNIKKQHINLTFIVDRVQGDTGFTRVQQYKVMPAAIKRKVRRQRDRLDESFTCVTKDNKIVRIKPLVITAIKTSRSVKSDLRNKVIQYIMNAVRKIDYDSLVMDLINEKFQREIANTMKKIVPIRFVDIRVMEYVGEQKGVAVETAEAPVEKPEPEKKPAEKKPVEKPAEMSEPKGSEHAQKAKLSDKVEEKPVEEKPEEKLEEKPKAEEPAPEPIEEKPTPLEEAKTEA